MGRQKGWFWHQQEVSVIKGKQCINTHAHKHKVSHRLFQGPNQLLFKTFFSFFGIWGTQLSNFTAFKVLQFYGKTSSLVPSVPAHSQLNFCCLCVKYKQSNIRKRRRDLCLITSAFMQVSSQSVYETMKPTVADSTRTCKQVKFFHFPSFGVNQKLMYLS